MDELNPASTTLAPPPMQVVMPTELRMRRVADLLAYTHNARTHSKEQVAQIATSITEFGWTNPILTDGTDGILAGHGRVLAAQLLGLAIVPTLDVSHLTAAQRKAYVLADNKIAENAGWDLDLLKTELQDLDAQGFDLSLTGFSDKELGELMAITPDDSDQDPDEVPDTPDIPHTAPGDMWLLGPHRILCGDSCSIDAWDTLMGSEKADIVWTDPPYNVAYESKLAGSIKNDDMDDAQFRQFLIDAHTCLFAVMKSGAAIYVAHADTEGLNFRAAFHAAGLKLSGCLIWRKDSLVLGRSDYQWQHEPILYGWKPGSAHKWYGGRKNTTVMELGMESPFVRQADGSYAIAMGDRVLVVAADVVVEDMSTSILRHDKPKRSAEHPTMKPVALVERMLKHNARPREIVVDAFSGSGTTLMAAERLGMCARVMELDPKFVDVCVKRWQEYTGRRAVHAVTGAQYPC